MKLINKIFCHFGWHSWVEVRIKWHDGGPHTEWWGCCNCKQLGDAAKQIKDWPPFTAVWK